MNGEYESYVSLINPTGEIVTLQMNEELSAVEINECIITAGTSALEDFKQLSRHRHVVAGCSTFSLCAGRVAWERQKSKKTVQVEPTLQLPLKWYQDEKNNEQIMKELSSCIFTRLR